MAHNSAILVRPAGNDTWQREGIRTHSFKALELTGLCLSCEEAEDCAFRDRGGVIHSCNEYRVVEPALAAERLARTVSPEMDAICEPEKGAGLCRNCMHREDCGLQHQPGGVWHCEEYAVWKEN